MSDAVVLELAGGSRPEGDIRIDDADLVVTMRGPETTSGVFRKKKEGPWENVHRVPLRFATWKQSTLDMDDRSLMDIIRGKSPEELGMVTILREGQEWQSVTVKGDWQNLNAASEAFYRAKGRVLSETQGSGKQGTEFLTCPNCGAPDRRRGQLCKYCGRHV